MRKFLIAFITLFISINVFAKDTFEPTKWSPFIDSTPVSLSNRAVFYYMPNGYINRVEGFAKTKFQNVDYYYLYVIDCSSHVISLWVQGETPAHVWSENLNPGHSVWRYRNEVCQQKIKK